MTVYSLNEHNLALVLHSMKTFPIDIKRYILNMYESNVPNIFWGIKIIDQANYIIHKSSMYQLVNPLSFFGNPLTVSICKNNGTVATVNNLKHICDIPDELKNYIPDNTRYILAV